MPLGKDVGKNIRELKEANKSKPAGNKRPQKQIVAIALDASRRKKK